MSWREIATAAGYVELPAAASIPLRSITACQGNHSLETMISLCLVCHVKVHRTKAVLSDMPPLLLELWREQHPYGHV